MHFSAFHLNFKPPKNTFSLGIKQSHKGITAYQAVSKTDKTIQS